MPSYTQILYQIVFSTKYRQKVLEKEKRVELFKYIWGIISKNKCHLYQINGVEDHIHILLSLHQDVALSKLVKDIKVSSSNYIKQHNLFPKFESWQIGYGAFTYNIGAKSNLINYIKNQEIHHAKITFEEEYIALLKEFEIEYGDDLFDIQP